MHKYLLSVAVLLSGSFAAHASTDDNLGQAVWVDGSTIPPTLNHSWWGSSGMHYLVRVTTDLETWTFLPNFNPSGTDATLGVEIPIETPRIFSRIFQFDPNSVSALGDSDNDGLPDLWELYYFGNLDRDGTGDYDGDGLSDLFEFQGGGNPILAPDATPTERFNITYDAMGRMDAATAPFTMSFSFDDEGSLLSVE